MDWSRQISGKFEIHSLTANDDDLDSGFEELVLKCLQKALAPELVGDWSNLSSELLLKETPEDEIGELFLNFTDQRLNYCPGFDRFVLRSEAFTGLQHQNFSHAERDRQFLTFSLRYYRRLKEAFQRPSLAELVDRIRANHPFQLFAGTGNGWFDMNLGEAGFGDLPENDRLLLEGLPVIPEDIISTLTACTVSGAGSEFGFEIKDIQ